MMEQQVHNVAPNGYLYDETCELYINRHRRLTISRMVKETKLPYNFVANFAQREQKNIEKVIKFRDYLKKYHDNPDLV
jgi:hypothetical protein